MIVVVIVMMMMMMMNMVIVLVVVIHGISQKLLKSNVNLKVKKLVHQVKQQ